MERRSTHRNRVPPTLVYIYYKGRRVHRCQVTDISPKGAYVQSEALSLPLGASIQLVFVLNHGKVSKTYRKSAVITRLSDTGAGLAFLKKRRARERQLA